MTKGLGHLSYEERLRELQLFTLLRQEGWTRWPTEVPSNPYILWFCLAWKTARSGEILSMYRNTWWEGVKNTETDYSQWCPVMGQEAMVKNQSTEKSAEKWEKSFFIVGAVKHWSRLPSEVVKSPSLEIFKTQLDKALSNRL